MRVQGSPKEGKKNFKGGRNNGKRGEGEGPAPRSAVRLYLLISQSPSKKKREEKNLEKINEKGKGEKKKGRGGGKRVLRSFLFDELEGGGEKREKLGKKGKEKGEEKKSPSIHRLS